MASAIVWSFETPCITKLAVSFFRARSWRRFSWGPCRWPRPFPEQRTKPVSPSRPLSHRSAALGVSGQTRSRDGDAGRSKAIARRLILSSPRTRRPAPAGTCCRPHRAAWQPAADRRPEGGCGAATGIKSRIRNAGSWLRASQEGPAGPRRITGEDRRRLNVTCLPKPGMQWPVSRTNLLPWNRTLRRPQRSPPRPLR